MEQTLYDNYVEILKHELVPALGCTEPIAIAYAAARARAVLGSRPEKISLYCSGNIIKNVKGVVVPNSGGQKGIEIAAILGVLGGDENKQLEVLEGLTDEVREEAQRLRAEGYCSCQLARDVPNLYLRVCVEGGGHSAEVVLEHQHTNITGIRRDGEHIFSGGSGAAVQGSTVDKSRLTVKDILEFAQCLNTKDVREVLERQIACNTAISQEGLNNPWGAQVGKTMLQVWGSDVKTRACARAAAGSDARMGGCSLPVVINSGSGNQGLTVTMPIVEYAREWGVSGDKLLRALALGNLVSLHLKYYIGSLSAFCGAVSAACGAGAGITYMYGGDYAHISRTIINTLGNVGGIVCDGAKPSCAAKIASSVNAALMGHYMGMEHKQFMPGEGIVEECVEETIKNMGYIGRVGMKETDVEILNVMIDRADVDIC